MLVMCFPYKHTWADLLYIIQRLRITFHLLPNYEQGFVYFVRLTLGTLWLIANAYFFCTTHRKRWCWRTPNDILWKCVPIVAAYTSNPIYIIWMYTTFISRCKVCLSLHTRKREQGRLVQPACFSYSSC